MRVAIYARVSTIDKGQDTELQLRDLRTYAQARGFDVSWLSEIVKNEHRSILERTNALEAAFMARPVVAARRGGLPEVVEHGSTGLLVDELNAPHLVEAIAWLLEHPEAASRMGKAARTRARTAFNWTDCVDAYETLYEKIVKAHDKHPPKEDHV